MSPKAYYKLILTVYILVLLTELIVCHLTHSIIILTDSYINLYNILQMTASIFYLTKLDTNNYREKNIKQLEEADKRELDQKNHTIFGRISTYELKRLPVIGEFISILFLAALLLSVATEGIQTCIHASHIWVEEESIIHQNVVTYPIILTSLAIIDCLLQYSIRLVKIKQFEIESFSNTRQSTSNDLKQVSSSPNPYQQLSAQQLAEQENNNKLSQRESLPNSLPLDGDTCLTPADKLSVADLQNRTLVTSQMKKKNLLEEVPTNDDKPTSISLKSIKIYSINESNNNNGVRQVTEFRESQNKKVITSRDIAKYDSIRSYSSPFALILCALVVYTDDNEFLSEFADASLSISVVILTFFSLYPPVKRICRILLQSIPDHVDIEALKAAVIREHVDKILRIDNLHIWGLTANDAQATCHLAINELTVKSGLEVNNLLKSVKKTFALHNVPSMTAQIKFATI